MRAKFLNKKEYSKLSLFNKKRILLNFRIITEHIYNKL